MDVSDNQNSYIYRIGLFLSIMYVFFRFVANGDFFPYVLQQIALYCLLGYGALIILWEITHGCFIIPEFSLYYIVILLLCILTNVYGEKKELIPGNMYSMIVCFLLTFTICIFIRSKKDFVFFCWGNIITSIVMALLLFISGKFYGTRVERLGNDISGNANVFAMGMMYPCMFALWLMIYAHYKKTVKLILLFSIIIDMYAITLSAGRKSFILPFVFFYLLLLYKRDDQNQKQRHIIKYTLITIAIVTLSVELLQNIPVLYNSVGSRIEQMLNELTGKGVVDNSTLVRSEFRKIAIEGWLKSPIFGHGFDSFKPYALERTGFYAYSHCNQTELLYCGGLILFVAYYGGYIHLFFKAKKACLPNEYSAFIKAAILAEFIFDFGLVSYNVFFVQSFIMLTYLAAGFTDQDNQDRIQFNQRQVSKYIR